MSIEAKSRARGAAFKAVGEVLEGIQVLIGRLSERLQYLLTIQMVAQLRRKADDCVDRLARTGQLPVLIPDLVLKLLP